VKCGDCTHRINGECREDSAVLVYQGVPRQEQPPIMGGPARIGIQFIRSSGWPPVHEDEAGCSRFVGRAPDVERLCHGPCGYPHHSGDCDCGGSGGSR